MPTVAVADTDKQVLKGLTRALEGKFKLQTFSGHIERDDEKLRFVDLIIYDLKAGRTSVAELKMLRQVEPTIPILVLAPLKSSTILEEALTVEATDFLAKPFNKLELQFRVERCLHHFGFRNASSGARAESSVKSVGSLKSQPRKTRVSIEVPLSDLHGPTGQLDAAAMANYLSIPLAKLAMALGMNYTTLHKTPDSAAVQPSLATIKRILVILSEMLGKRETVLAWLNSPHPDLGNRTPISVVLEGHASAVASLLENALAGVPS
jgi:FixJ family two-component response regulator